MAKLNTKRATVIHRCIVFGAPFSGKSLLVGKLAEYYKLIWVDMENGHDVLFQLPKKWQERIELINLPDTRSYPIAIETCLKMIKSAVSICEEHGKAGCMICKREESAAMQALTASDATEDNTAQKKSVHKNLFIDVDLNNLPKDAIVVFDSMTQLTNSAIAHITKREADDYKLDFDDWGHLGKLLDIFLSHLQQSNYHVIVISHETEAETEGRKKKLVPVGGTRNFSRNMAKYFDHVVYAEIKNKKHFFTSSTHAATNILTGSRTSIAIEDFEEASLLQIFKPELYPQTPYVVHAAKTGQSSQTKQTQPVKQQPNISVKSAKSGGEKATDILARLRKK